MWIQVDEKRFERSDGAIVRYDEDANMLHAQPWKLLHRGWMAYSPNHNFPLSYRLKKGFNVARKFMTAETAMRVVDREFPL